MQNAQRKWLHKNIHTAPIFKPVTDEQVFYDKFLCDKFYFLVWTCQKKVFTAAMTEKL
jgi:hypothetical protein